MTECSQVCGGGGVCPRPMNGSCAQEFGPVSRQAAHCLTETAMLSAAMARRLAGNDNCFATKLCQSARQQLKSARDIMLGASPLPDGSEVAQIDTYIAQVEATAHLCQ